MHPPRLPVPHLFMGMSAGVLAMLMLATVSDTGGSTLTSPLAFPALLTATLRAGRPGTHGHRRPLLGLGAGLLTGLAGASSLVGMGLLPPGGPQWIYLPLLFATLGTMLGLTASARPPMDGAAGNRQRQDVATQPDRGLTL